MLEYHNTTRTWTSFRMDPRRVQGGIFVVQMFFQLRSWNLWGSPRKTVVWTADQFWLCPSCQRTSRRWNSYVPDQLIIRGYLIRTVSSHWAADVKPFYIYTAAAGAEGRRDEDEDDVGLFSPICTVTSVTRRDSAAVLSVWVRLGSSEARLRFVLSIILQEVFQTADFSSQNKTLPLLWGGSKQRANARWNKGLWVIPRISGIFSLGPRWEGSRFSPRDRD